MVGKEKGTYISSLYACMAKKYNLYFGSNCRFFSYLIYFKQKQKILALDNEVDSQPEDAGNATIYVSGIKESTSEDTITLFFESKKSGGGDLCEGEEGYKRLSATVARLTFFSSKGNVFI
jgi:hypothetical protein